jgi:NAD(P)-dependent dehydrogenase (short-subunit alcohol dehydrogenase family)
MSKPIALIIGVGAEKGIGGALCQRAQQAGYHVAIVGRTAAKIDTLAAQINAEGGSASAHVTDVGDEAQMLAMFADIDALEGDLAFVTYNAGSGFRHETASMSGQVFEDVWRVTCLGGFIAGREAAKRLAALGQGTLVFTGATASIKARPPFLAFASAKAGLRAVAAGLAREFGPKNVHVGHVIIDGGVDGAIRRKRIPADAETAGENEILSPDAIAESYWQLHLQHRSAWSFEIDLRPFSEVF